MDDPLLNATACTDCFSFGKFTGVPKLEVVGAIGAAAAPPILNGLLPPVLVNEKPLPKEKGREGALGLAEAPKLKVLGLGLACAVPNVKGLLPLADT